MMGVVRPDRIILLGAVLATLGAGDVIVAGTAVAQTAEAPQRAGAITQIESVTTTARKREEPLQEAPVAVTALSGEALALKYTTDLKTLNFPAPSVNISKIGVFGNSVSVFIRGIGNGDVDATTDPPVAIFVDGVYIARPEASSLDLFDVEAIEIMRGPQGTLFGRNTTAGAIQVRTRRPSGDFDMRGRLTFGQYGHFDIRASIDVPIVQGKVDAKLAVLSTQNDGFYRDSVSGGKLGGEDSLALRPMIRFTPTENFEFTLIGEYNRARNDLLPGVNGARPGQVLCAAWGYCGRPRAPRGEFTKADFLVTTDHPNAANHNDVWGLTGELVWDVGPGAITWVSNYRKSDSFIEYDTDGTAAPMFYTTRDTTHKQASTELRFASSAWDDFDFVAGVYGFYQKYYLHRRTLNQNSPVAAIADTVSNTGQTHKSVSVFAEGNYHVTDRLTLTVGGRYSWEEKSFFQEPFGPFPNPGPRIEPDPASWSNFGPKAGISYQVTDDALAYATYSRGFKSGGWNGRGGTPTTLGPYDPEVVDAFEVGLKSDWFGSRLRANLSLFLNEYKDLQRTVIRFLPGAPNPQETVTSNAASAKIKGVEFELTAIPVEGLQLTANASYLDAKYGNFCADLDGPSFFASAPTSPCGGTVANITAPGGTGPGNYLLDDDFSGIPLQRAPKFQLTLGATYEIPVGDVGSVVLNANYSYISNLNVSVAGVPIAERGKVNLVDASITYKDIDGRYSVSLFGRNLTNEIYLDSITQVSVLFDTYGLSAPRRWGVELSFDL